MTLGERLRSLRKARNLKREQLAAAIGVTPRVITFYETNDREPSLRVLIALADFFDVSLDYLVGRSDNPRRR
ncbi:helix-turn-helix domain-containing protein [Thermanaeromonas sp. C210]|uniref:helix-turn-helix domain-containing protein n=1 Tax=Thermanaeromonas sp. C210 TaxID=2731925 RepID=UPI0015632385|nr:helix-turn-helix transcriptional regulator [Thermanaeromonas sp. C210]